ncbi:class I SAM-dependent methyltransferase [Methanoculleus methanifontis]|nr:class I SAM-dependent methyltransferase [Methanoculleus sp. FWC-SCC3]
MSKTELYRGKSNHYFSGVRWDIISLIPDGAHRILEVGCGTGNTLIKLRELNKAQEIIGIELNYNILQDNCNRLDAILVGDVEEIEPAFEEGYFDYIIFADVLEHLVNSAAILERYSLYLKSTGYIIASIPNVKNYRILLDLVLYDKFEYADAGILDRSHLRFFTRREMYRLFNKAGLGVVSVQPKFGGGHLGNIDRRLNHSVGRYLPGGSFLATQYIIKAIRRNGTV